MTSDSTGFLYPFLAGAAFDEGALLDDLAASARAKRTTSGALLATTLDDAGPDIDAAAEALAAAARTGGRALVAGNGGSAADAAGFAALLRQPPWGVAMGALCLAEDPTILTALANDVGVGLVFARQAAAHGGPGDVLVALSTSGRSENIVKALAAARRAGMVTIAVTGEGGRDLRADGAADHVVVVSSDSVHRVQETQEAVLFEVWARAQLRIEEVQR